MRQKQNEFVDKPQTLLQGSLKHTRIAALAALMMAFAVVLATTAVASSQCPECPPPSQPPPCGFVTSGGFVLNDVGKEVNFGAHGGCKNGEFWGNVNLVDHSTGYHLNSVEVTGFFNPTDNPNVRDICGFAHPAGGQRRARCSGSFRDPSLQQLRTGPAAARRWAQGRRQRATARTQPVDHQPESDAGRSHDVQWCGGAIRAPVHGSDLMRSLPWTTPLRARSLVNPRRPADKT
jgi:hypothetical protein